MAAAGLTMGRASELAGGDLFWVNLGWTWGLFLQPSVHHSHDLKTMKSSQSTNSISLAKGREKTQPTKVTGVLPLGGPVTDIYYMARAGQTKEQRKVSKKESA